MKSWVVFVLLSLLSGCITPYAPPLTGDLATLTIANDSAARVAITIYNEGADCSGGFKYMEGKVFHDPGTAKELKIAAGRPFSFIVEHPMGVVTTAAYGGTRTTSYECVNIGTVTATPNSRYRVSIGFSEGRCTLQAVEVTEQGQKSSSVLRLRGRLLPVISTMANCR